MRSSIFVLAAAIGLAAAQCDETSVTTCLVGVENNVANCRDVACICNYLKTGLNCYNSYCPAVSIPAEVTDNYSAFCSGGALATETFALPTESFTFPTESFTFPTESFTFPTESFTFPSESFTFPSETATLEEPTLTRSSRITTAPTTAPTAARTLSTITSAPTLLSGGAQTTGTGVQAQQTSTSTAAADVLLVPAGGLIAGLVAVLAWL